MTDISSNLQDKLDAAAFRKLLSHLDANKSVQNIDLMILADFCRNCLGDWYKQAADEHGVDMSKDEARARVYGMPYSDWKSEHQLPATDEQLQALKKRTATKAH